LDNALRLSSYKRNCAIESIYAIYLLT
jgi:hypothetical protein